MDTCIQNCINNINKCQDSFTVENHISLAMEMLFDGKIPPLYKFEDSCLNLASSGSTDCVFMCIVFSIKTENNEVHTMARFFESGTLKGFFQNVGFNFLKETLNLEVILPYQVYTRRDIEKATQRSESLYSSRKNGKKTPLNAKNKLYDRTISTNINSMKQIVDKIKPSLEKDQNCCIFQCCFVMHRIQKWGKPESENDRRFLVCDGDSKTWEKLLLTYRVNHAEENNSLQFDSETNEELTLEDQFFLLSSIPNFHKWTWFPEPKKMEVKFIQRFSTSCERYPGSPRNRILQACLYRDDASRIVEAILQSILGNDVEIPYQQKRKKSVAPQRKVRKIVPADQPVKMDCVESNENSIDVSSPGFDLQNIAFSFKESLYQYYCGQLFNHGIIRFRIRVLHKNVLVLNDYDPETGDFLQYKYVHVTATTSTIRPCYHCTCQIFSLSQNSVLITSQLEDTGIRLEENGCLHTRLMACVLSLNPTSELLSEQETPDLESINPQKVNDAIKFSDTQVTELPAKLNVEKFSIVGADSVSIVSVFQVSATSRKVVQCHNSVCGIAAGNKRALDTVKTSLDMCEHLQLFRDFISQEEYRCEGIIFNEEDYENEIETEVGHLPDNKWKDVFDEDTGFWRFDAKSPSKDKVDIDPFSPVLEENIQIRDGWTGINPVYDFYPVIADESCPCGAGWCSETDPEGKFFCQGYTNVYLEKKVVRCRVFRRSCTRLCCWRDWDGAKQSIFRLSNNTCAGYEIGWDFVHSVKSSGQSFSSFVDRMNESYKRRNRDAQNFMSVPVFIDWFFAWVSRMEIDFRQPCYWCGGTSKLLACDGTKLGIGFKNAFVKPIESKEKDGVVKTQFRRLDRCFIFNTQEHQPSYYQKAREDLEVCCRVILESKAEDASFIEICNDVINKISIYSQSCFARMTGLSGTCAPGEKKALAKFFLHLAYNASIDTTVPFRFCNEISDFVEGVKSETLAAADVRVFCYRAKYFCPEISSVVLQSMLSSNLQYPSEDIIHFMEYLVASVRNIHTHDEPEDEAIPIPGTYNPAKYGRAYYFHQHGCQVRRMRQFSLEKDKKNGNFDDDPDTMCEKRFPVVSKKGTTYLFLWFCPTHGHCYGFHIIPGSEGRKDPAASLYTHSVDAPDDILYDFACSLSEYAKNRESGYFSKTRFFHDVFHGYSHKCTKSFRCNRLLGFDAVNSSICEQFNSYIQKIKASARLMSQAHFTLYLQFFIHLWNQAKFETFRKRLRVAASGREENILN